MHSDLELTPGRQASLPPSIQALISASEPCEPLQSVIGCAIQSPNLKIKAKKYKGLCHTGHHSSAAAAWAMVVPDTCGGDSRPNRV